MKTRGTIRVLGLSLTVALCEAAFVALPPAAAQTESEVRDDFGTLAEQAKGALGRGDDALAQSLALRLLELDANRHEGHMYLGISFYRQRDLQGSESSLSKALALASDPEKAEVRAALELVKNTILARAEVQAAQKAEAEGTFAKAADGYTRAWMRLRSDATIGLKAAELRGKRLADPIRAAQILRAILEDDSSKSSAVGVRATALLSELQPTLSVAYDTAMKEGASQKASGELNAARLAFMRAVDAMPTRKEPHLHIATIHLRWQRRDAVKTAILAASRAGATSEDLARNTELAGLIADEDYGKFVADVFGAEGVLVLKSSMQARRNEEQCRASCQQGVQRCQDQASQCSIECSEETSRCHRNQTNCEDAAFQRGRSGSTCGYNFRQCMSMANDCKSDCRQKGESQACTLDCFAECRHLLAY